MPDDILGGLKNITIEAKSFNGHKHVWLSIIHVALPLLSEKTSLISPQIILQVYKKIFPIRWFLIGLLVARTVKLLKTKYAERIAIVRIQKTGLGLASATKVMRGTQ
ncbi:hypothetical protein CMV_003129 [Castanea mollissima]|uniref:Uncharacterized protein n=1 Tax=Castanea mollissima TaxID=60419 RepID=A0A8J4VWG2_9ROSI|nr:hypothetical protein CMV_003129 [Castanea mollissima]